MPTSSRKHRSSSSPKKPSHHRCLPKSRKAANNKALLRMPVANGSTVHVVRVRAEPEASAGILRGVAVVYAPVHKKSPQQRLARRKRRLNLEKVKLDRQVIRLRVSPANAQKPTNRRIMTARPMPPPPAAVAVVAHRMCRRIASVLPLALLVAPQKLLSRMLSPLLRI